MQSLDTTNLPMETLFSLQKKVERLESENKMLKESLEFAYINDNFGCYTRIGGVIRGNEYLQQERRRVKSGQLLIITIDVGGMGVANSLVGELEVNRRITNCLETIRSWRGVEFISQINSGDEFGLFADRVDAPGLLPKIDKLFRESGFTRAYGAIGLINSNYIQSANECMQLVYEQKRFAKLLSAIA